MYVEVVWYSETRSRNVESGRGLRTGLLDEGLDDEAVEEEPAADEEAYRQNRAVDLACMAERVMVVVLILQDLELDTELQVMQGTIEADFCRGGRCF